MKVRVKRSFANPDISAEEGQIIEVPENHGLGDLVEPVEAKSKSKADVLGPETASIEPPETEAMPAPTRRKKS